MTMPGQPSGKWQISRDGGAFPAWRRDGRELYFLGPDRQGMMAVNIDPGPPFRPGVTRLLFKTGAFITSLDAAADGQKFLIGIRSPSVSDAPITVVLNWQAGLKK